MDVLTQRVTLVRIEAERLQDYLGPLPVAIAEGHLRMQGNRESIPAFAQWFMGV